MSRISPNAVVERFRSLNPMSVRGGGTEVPKTVRKSIILPMIAGGAIAASGGGIIACAGFLAAKLFNKVAVTKTIQTSSGDTYLRSVQK